MLCSSCREGCCHVGRVRDRDDGRRRRLWGKCQLVRDLNKSLIEEKHKSMSYPVRQIVDRKAFDLEIEDW